MQISPVPRCASQDSSGGVDSGAQNSPMHAGSVVVVVGVVVVGVVVVVLLVVVAAHPVEVQASQQLVKAPTHAVPPLGAVQCAASRFTLHFVRPTPSVRQQLTNPGFPHVDLAAHLLTVRRQLGFCSVSYAFSMAHLT